MNPRRRGIGKTIQATLLVLLLATVILAASLDIELSKPPESHTVTVTATTTATRTTTFPVTATYTVTATSTVTTTTTIATGPDLSEVCTKASSLPILPSPNMPWLSVGVSYPTSWEAFAVVYDNGSLVFSGCYAGAGPGYFIYQNSSISSNATILVTAYKLDGSNNTLQLGADNSTSSTSAPYGSVTVTGFAVGPAF